MKKLFFGDKCGEEITVGSFIIYGIALGRSSGLRFGKVLEIVPHKDDKTIDGDRNCKIKVIGVDDSWISIEPKLQSKPSLLYFGERTLKIEKRQISEKALKLLEEY